MTGKIEKEGHKITPLKRSNFYSSWRERGKDSPMCKRQGKEQAHQCQKLKEYTKLKIIILRYFYVENDPQRLKRSVIKKKPNSRGGEGSIRLTKEKTKPLYLTLWIVNDDAIALWWVLHIPSRSWILVWSTMPKNSSWHENTSAKQI